MAEQTPNYGLTKPDSEDFYDVEVQNSNMDIIDGALKDSEKQLTEHFADYNQKIKQLNKGRCLIQSDVNTLIPQATAKQIDLSAIIVNETFYQFDGTTSTLKFKKNGLYLINAAVTFLNAPADTSKMTFFVPRLNGMSVYGEYMPKLIATGGTNFSLSGVTFINVKVDDNLMLEAFHDFTGSVNVKGKIDIINLIEV